MTSNTKLIYFLPNEECWLTFDIKNTFNVNIIDSLDNCKSYFKKNTCDIFICNESNLDIINHVRKLSKSCFICIYSEICCNNPTYRMKLFNEYKVNMISYDKVSIFKVLSNIKTILSTKGKLSCPSCNQQNLTEDGLWLHDPLYHVNDDNISNFNCPICNKKIRQPWTLHIHYKHGPVGRGEMECADAIRSKPALYSFALVVCKHPITNKYLLVQEFCNSGYWLPGGAVDSGEDIKVAAIRETKEEAGIDVELKGVLRTELSPKKDYVRLRVIFYAEPVNNDDKPKSIPDFESVGATWISAEEITRSHLRGKEPLNWSNYLENGGPIYPLTTLTREHTPVTIPKYK